VVDVAHDPLLYALAAPHYRRGRPPYSDRLLDVLSAELGLDGHGGLLDVGCGPGVLAVQLAGAFDAVTGLDPDAGMLEEGARHAAASGVAGIRWIAAAAEDIAVLDLAPMRLVTFGQSLQWTAGVAVAEAVHDLLTAGGAIALITHDIDHRPAPIEPPATPIPHDDLRLLVKRYLGDADRAGSGRRPVFAERYEVTLARSRFGAPTVLHAPGRTDIVRDADEVISGVLSMSWAAPHLFGTRLGAFVADAHELLAAASPDGRFWDWPGDTAILLARTH
jgi:SAM-dependent methyltransferase